MFPNNAFYHFTIRVGDKTDQNKKHEIYSNHYYLCMVKWYVAKHEILKFTGYVKITLQNKAISLEIWVIWSFLFTNFNELTKIYLPWRKVGTVACWNKMSHDDKRSTVRRMT